MKRIILFILIAISVSIGQYKQSYNSLYPSKVFGEYFNDEYSVRANSGVPTSVVYSQGSGVFNGSTSYLKINKALKGTYSLRLRVNLPATNSGFLLDFRADGGTGYLYYSGTTTLEATSGTVYVNGNVSTTTGTSTKEIVVSGISINAKTIYVGCRNTLANFVTASISEIEIYNRSLSSAEIKNLYDGVAHKDLVANQAEVLGSELITNQADREFTNDTGFWGRNSGMTIADNVCHFTNATSGLPFYRNGFLTVGKQYKVSYEIKNYVAGKIRLTGVSYYEAGQTTNGTNTLYFIADVANLVWLTSGTTTLDLDNVSVKEVLSASTPLLIDFNSTAGQIIDKRGNTITNTATTAKRAGSIFSADFNGSTSKLNFGNIDGLTGDITICGWVKARGIGENNGGTILDNTKFLLQTVVTNRLLFSSDYSVSAYTATGAFLYNKYYFVCITRTSSGVTNFYLGDSKTPPTISGTANQSSGTPVNGLSIIVGNRASQVATWNGLIPQIRIYKSILTQADFTRIWQSTVNNYVGD